jgi:16S rRNA (cytosine967-C5)-methyltransferase
LLLLTHIPPHAALNETVALADAVGIPRAKGFINGVLRALVPLLTQHETGTFGADALPLPGGVYRTLGRAVLPDPAASPVEYLSQAFSLPIWLADRWLKRFGWEECLRLGFWFAGAAPLTLRINPLRCRRDEFLRDVGEQAEAGSHPQSVRWRTHAPVADIPGYAEGYFVVQDETAMNVATALAPRAGEHVLDLCAAPGGKTTHLAELMGNEGRVLACDVAASKLAPLQETCRRLGLTIVETKVVNAGPDWPTDLVGPFDAVLVDAPCSNTGVLGRRPEARWRLKPADLRHLALLQIRLLRQGCALVRPGGRVVYATCSIEPEENRRVVDAFLKDEPALLLEADEEALPGCPADGGYWARLRRRQ